MKPRLLPAGQWCVYVLRCVDGSLYCGITNHLARRIEQHNRGTGARYTRGRAPVKLARAWPHPDRSTAAKAECAFKKLNRQAKEARIVKKRGGKTPRQG